MERRVYSEWKIIVRRFLPEDYIALVRVLTRGQAFNPIGSLTIQMLTKVPSSVTSSFSSPCYYAPGGKQDHCAIAKSPLG